MGHESPPNVETPDSVIDPQVMAIRAIRRLRPGLYGRDNMDLISNVDGSIDLLVAGDRGNQRHHLFSASELVDDKYIAHFNPRVRQYESEK